MENRPQHLAELTSLATETEAALLVAALQEAGIAASYAGGATANFQTGAPGGVDVLVNEHDLELAQETLRRIRESSSTIDWNTVDTGDRGDTTGADAKTGDGQP